jgi:hypothetical protein
MQIGVCDGEHNVIRFKNDSTIDLIDVAYKPTDPDYERTSIVPAAIGQCPAWR